jgi:hypothetical protein
VDSAVDAARVLSLGLAIPFPVSLIQAGDIIPGGWQHIRAAFSPQFEGDAVRFQDFFCRLVAEVSPSLIRCFRVPEQSAIPRSGNPRNRLLAMPIKCQKPAFDTLLQVANGGIAVEFPAFQENELLSRFKSVAIVEFFDAHWFPLKGNREVIRGFPRGNRKF